MMVIEANTSVLGRQVADTMDADSLVSLAESFRDRLRAEQEQTEIRGCYSPEIHEEFTKAGFYRILQPRRFGGLEMSVTTFYRVVMALGRGCPSTAWCFSLGAGHALVVGSHWNEDAQRAIFGDGHFVAPHRGVATGKLVREQGGYRVNGTWNYCSGVPYATHVLVGASIVDADGNEEPGIQVAVVPISQCEILDDWGNGQMLGLNGTGSFSVTVKDGFIPEDWVVPFDWHNKDLSNGTPGTRLHGNPMYLGRNMSFYGGEIIASMAGLGRAAVDAAEDVLRTRKTLVGPPMPRAENPDFLRYFGHSLGQVHCAEELVLRAGDRYAEVCKDWADGVSDFSEADDVAINSLLIHAAELVDEATRRLFATAGSREAHRSAPLQRYVRDIMTQRSHLAGWGTLANMGELRGRVEVTGTGITPG